MTLIIELSKVEPFEIELLIPDTNTLIRQAKQPSQIVAVVGAPGVPGPPGPAAYTVTAAEALGGNRAVTVDGYHATPATLDKLIGITTGAVSLGEDATVVRWGIMTEPSWTWTADQPIFVGAAGVLTQTPPVSGTVRRIAWAVSPTQISIDLFPTIRLA